MLLFTPTFSTFFTFTIICKIMRSNLLSTFTFIHLITYNLMFFVYYFSIILSIHLNQLFLFFLHSFIWLHIWTKNCIRDWKNNLPTETCYSYCANNKGIRGRINTNPLRGLSIMDCTGQKMTI